MHERESGMWWVDKQIANGPGQASKPLAGQARPKAWFFTYRKGKTNIMPQIALIRNSIEFEVKEALADMLADFPGSLEAHLFRATGPEFPRLAGFIAVPWPDFVGEEIIAHYCRPCPQSPVWSLESNLEIPLAVEPVAGPLATTWPKVVRP
jgi:hypothetical protein